MRGEILAKISPSKKEARAMKAFAAKAAEELSDALKARGFKAEVEIHGSAARDTWISEHNDIDMFIVLDRARGRKILPEVLEALKAFVGDGWVEAYAEHPYIRARMDGYNVEFVPCFRVEKGKPLLSATDRTPLHTRYLSTNLRLEQRDEVRLLKKFVVGTGVYGAEMRTEGFSGYLCELLILHYGSFERLVEAAAGWRETPVIQLNEAKPPDELRKLFKEPLIVVDPVDDGRNVASAVSETSLWTFVAAARSFVAKPRKTFFFPNGEPVDREALLRSLGGERDVLFLVVDDPSPDVPDTLWGQLHKAEKTLARHLRDRGFKVTRSVSWSDERSRHVICFELESAIIPWTVKQLGPPVWLTEDSAKFLEAHLASGDVVSGPAVEGSRWWVVTRRRYNDAKKMLGEVIVDGGVEVGTPKRLAVKVASCGRVLLNGEVAGCLEGDFPAFLQRFLKGRPEWLE
jgi:tRNA nucleotidyltransferase (CCA-adding enzyme)